MRDENGSNRWDRRRSLTMMSGIVNAAIVGKFWYRYLVCIVHAG